MDFIGDIIDWVIKEVIKSAGATAAQLNVSAEQLALIHGIWQYFILAGIGLTIVYFIVEINKRWAFEGQNMTLKTMFNPFIKFGIAVALMANAGEIFTVIATFNNTFAGWAADVGTGEGGGAAQSIGETLVNNLDFWQKIIMIFPTILTWIISLVCSLVWVYKAMLYKMELIARIAFAPIALADVYSGFNSTAVKYVKGTIALIIYGGTLIILPKLCISIAFMDMADMMKELTAQASLGNVMEVILAYVKLMIAPIAAIGLSSAARQITKEAVG